jgi:hypothetical protein
MRTFADHLRQEGRALRSRMGIGRAAGSRAILIHLAVVAVFGVYLPWMKGFEFLDPAMLAAYACLGILFAAPAAAQACDDEPPRSMTDAMARIGMAVLYGECMMVTILAAGFITVYTTRVSVRRARLAPDVDTLAAAGALGLAASFALATLAACMALRFSPGVARAGLRAIFLLLLGAFFLWERRLPDAADTGALVCLAVAAAAIFALRTILKGAA